MFVGCDNFKKNEEKNVRASVDRVHGREWNPSTTDQTAALQPYSLACSDTERWKVLFVGLARVCGGSSTAALIFEMVENLPSFELAGKQDVHKENARHTDKAPKQGVFGDGQSVAEREFKDVGHREEGSVAEAIKSFC